MKLFEDVDLTQEINIAQPINFGRLQAGETKEFKFHVFNETQAIIEDLEFEVDNKEVHIISAPKELTQKASDELILKWEPSVTIKEGLKAEININGIEVWE